MGTIKLCRILNAGCVAAALTTRLIETSDEP